MKNLKKISKRTGIIIIFSILLSGFIYSAPAVLAVSADRDNFVILGRASEDAEALIEEKIVLRTAPDIGSQEQGRIESGATVLVCDKKNIGSKGFYFVMKIGEGGGLSGWVSEDYIYAITTEPQR